METMKIGILNEPDSGIEQQNANFHASQSYFNNLLEYLHGNVLLGVCLDILDEAVELLNRRLHF